MPNAFFRGFLRRSIFLLGYYFRLFDLVGLFFSRHGYVPVLVYHKIHREAEGRNARPSMALLGLSVPEKAFEEQIKYLKEKYTIIHLEDYILQAKSGKGSPIAAVVTFDDGFSDMGQEALKKYAVPAIVFLIGEAFRGIFWKHRLYSLLDGSAVMSFKFFWEGRELRLALDSDEAKIKAVKILVKVFNGVSEPKRQQAFGVLAEALKIDVAGGSQKIYLRQEDISLLMHQNIHFGAHSMAHVDLRGLNDAQLSEEIAGSRRKVESLTGKPVSCFSLPMGRYDERVIARLKEEGFECICTSDHGLNSPRFDRFRVKRIAITAQTLPEFVYQVSGTQMLLHELIGRLKFHG